jgi:hypothetical protein
LHKASADECENMTGALVTSNASTIVWTDTCDRSTIIPSRFISRITSWKLKDVWSYTSVLTVSTLHYFTEILVNSLILFVFLFCDLSCRCVYSLTYRTYNNASFCFISLCSITPNLSVYQSLSQTGMLLSNEHFISNCIQAQAASEADQL